MARPSGMHVEPTLQPRHTPLMSPGRPARPPFVLRSSREVFTDEELEVLEEYGRGLERLADGKRLPNTPAQQRFVAVVRGELEPETIYERAWMKYLLRVDWESDPANRAAMGTLRRMPNDREDWKRMRSAVWGEVRRRARGLDD